jgi:outer membrane receptor protein involved in Fe transport
VPHRVAGSCLLASMLVAATAARAQPADEIDTEALFDFLRSEVTVTTTTPRTIRDAPGIVSVISREEIVRSGARDLIDLLQMVPGFDLAVDVQNTVGLGVRGNWGHEGKVLLLIDGLEMNELMYSTLQLGNHYPVENIEKIEIMRGPGSAVYGGFAELAVIKVTTLSGAARSGATARVTYGRMPRATARANLEVGYGQSLLGGDLDVSVSALVGEGRRSDRTFQDVYGDRVRLDDGSDLDPGHVNVGISYKGATVRFMYDNFRTRELDGFDAILPRAYSTEFLSYLVAAQVRRPARRAHAHTAHLVQVQPPLAQHRR